jgi:carbonic anhydrase
MDFRLTKDVHAWMEEKGLVNDCDIISVAGAAKDIAENPQGYVFSLIKLSIELHGIKKVFLMQHRDCGAYGGSAAFSNQSEEFAKHKSEMDKAREIIARQFPNIAVETCLVSPAGKRWKVEII